MLSLQHGASVSNRQQGLGTRAVAAVRRPPSCATPRQHPLRCKGQRLASGNVYRSSFLQFSAITAAIGSNHATHFDSDDYEWDELEWTESSGPASLISAVGGGMLGSTLSMGNHTPSPEATNSHSSGAKTATMHSNKQQQPAHEHKQQQHASPAALADEGNAGGGLVGLFVAAWMAVIGLLLQALQPVVSVLLLLAQPLTNISPARAKHQLRKLAAELPEGFWAKLHFLWELPVVKSIRITLSVANWGVRLPAIAALLLTQGSLLASQVSLPMLAPLLLGTGMMMNSIKKNASYIFPRVGLLVVLLWLLWFVNSVIQNTWLVLRNTGRIDARTMSGARMITECSSLLLAGILVLSALGININALLLPTGVVLAIASKDLLQNLIAGFYLVLVQPFRLGDKVAVSCSLPSGPPPPAAASSNGKASGSSSSLAAATGVASSSGSSRGGAVGVVQGWFEGVCEKVDLRYTVLRDGRRRLMVPNTAFVSREFLVYDDGPVETARPGTPSSTANSSSSKWPGASTANMPDAATAAEPMIREGHMTTELPPLGHPIFPGMTLIQPPPGYPQYAPQHAYAAVPPYVHRASYGSMHQHVDEHDELHKEQEQDDQQLKQQQQQGTSSAAAAGDGSSVHRQQQQDGSTKKASSSSRATTARGPPGYLPQGYTTGQYYGIPLYWTLPGMLGPWSGTPSGGQQQAQQQQQYYEQHYFEYNEPAGMHQPVPAHSSMEQHHQPSKKSSSQQQQRKQSQQSQDPWQQHHWRQAAPQQQQQQQHLSAHKSAAPENGKLDKTLGGGSSSRTASQSSRSHNHTDGEGSGNYGSMTESKQHEQEQRQRQQQQQDFHQQAVHVAAMSGGSYAFWGNGTVPPEAVHQHLQYQQYTPAVHMQYNAVHQQPHLPHHQYQQQQHLYHLGEQHAASDPAYYMQPPYTMYSGSQQHQQRSPRNEASESAPAAAAPAGVCDVSRGASSPTGTAFDQLAAAQPINVVEPSSVMAAECMAPGALAVLQPYTSSVTAAASAAAFAGSAARHLQEQQFGAAAQQVAGKLLQPIVGVCRELGQELSEM